MCQLLILKSFQMSTTQIKLPKQFGRILIGVRAGMPVMFVILTFLNYLLCGIVTGILLSNYVNPVIAFGIGIVTQLIRGSLVFAGQLNPHTKIHNVTPHAIVAIIMGVAAIVEVYLLADKHLFYSLSFLIASGVGIEIYLLSAFVVTTNLQIISDKTLKASVKQYAVQMDEFNELMSRLKEDSGEEAKHLFNGTEKEMEIVSDERRKEIVLEMLSNREDAIKEVLSFIPEKKD